MGEAVGADLILAPTVLTVEVVEVPILLVADALTSTKVSKAKEKGAEERTLIGIIHYKFDLIVGFEPSQLVVSVLHPLTESFISIK